jgi:hypothetical protein
MYGDGLHSSRPPLAACHRSKPRFQRRVRSGRPVFGKAFCSPADPATLPALLNEVPVPDPYSRKYILPDTFSVTSHGLIFSSANIFLAAPLTNPAFLRLYSAKHQIFAKSFFPEASSAFPHRGPSKTSPGQGFSLTLGTVNSFRCNARRRNPPGVIEIVDKFPATFRIRKVFSR